jgi:hypothetical protein
MSEQPQEEHESPAVKGTEALERANEALTLADVGGRISPRRRTPASTVRLASQFRRTSQAA